MNKYEILVNTLDQIRKEAPSEYKSYYPLEGNSHGIDAARSKALIHLFLKVKFGILDFKEREEHITEGTQDGGIDAYYIDDEFKQVFYIQSKFRTNEKNFSEKEIVLSELLNMDLDRIAKGEVEDAKGIPYNSKILKMIDQLKRKPDRGIWKHNVVIVANLNKSISDEQIMKLTGGFAATIYNHEKVYEDLLFHCIQGTYYNPKELVLALNLSNTSTSSSRIKYKVQTRVFECEIQVLFIPTFEIAKALYKYKNSILRYNLRSYLELANNNVNRDIAKSIKDLNCNEFALYNNGITMLSTDTVYSEQTFEKYAGQLLIKQPQIINGGQTAFTLSRLYEDCLNAKEDMSIFEGKEVLLKVIKLPSTTVDQPEIRELMEAISKATNYQTAIEDADRRANDLIQIQLQENIYRDFGYFYERKRGEFADGIRYHYLHRSQLIDRETFIRLSKCCDLEPSEARRSSKSQLFQPQNFSKTLNDISRYKERLMWNQKVD